MPGFAPGIHGFFRRRRSGQDEGRRNIRRDDGLRPSTRPMGLRQKTNLLKPDHDGGKKARSPGSAE